VTNEPKEIPKIAMVLAAGLGTRMRPLSETRPKCLLPVAGRPTLDRVLDHLEEAGVETAVVNLHYRPEMIRAHLAGREAPRLVFSDESDAILDTGGGVARALDALGPRPFYVVNGISLWSDGAGGSALRRLAQDFEPERMDALLLLQACDRAIGYDGDGDFDMTTDGRLVRRRPDGRAAYVFVGAQILRPELFQDAPAGAFSLNLLYDRARDAGRLFGLAHDGDWMNLKTPEALAEAERALGGGSG
jgi:MurNAc alpha-1-phosphate uridylyltransferase